MDNWHPTGALIEKYGYHIVYDAHSRLEAHLSSVISNGNWNWRPARSNDLVDIQARLSEVRIGTIDKPIWSGSRSNTYVSSDTWEMLRSRNSNVDWWHLVWFPLAIPKQAFILWLAMRNTCRHSLESRDHLFFECSFSFRIWRDALSRCNVPNPPNAWIDILRLGGSDWKKKTMHGNLCRLVLSSSVYHLWKNRNEIKHGGTPKTEEQILKSVVWDVRTRIFGGGKFQKNVANVLLCKKWNINEEMLV
jgi:hypothetical protein